MKFTDGLWERPTGSIFQGGVDVVEVLNAKDDGLEYMVATKPVVTRGDTLNGSTLTFQVSSPANDIIKVEFSHWQGAQDDNPKFELFPDGAPAKPSTSSSNDSDHLSFTSGDLSATIAKKSRGYTLDFAHKGEYLTGTVPKGSAVVNVPARMTLGLMSEAGTLSHSGDVTSDVATNRPALQRFMLNELNLSVDENIYGLGERFGTFIKNGQRVGIWNQDGGTDSEQAYKNIPFYISSRGYGVFVDHTDEVEFEVGNEKSSKVGFSVRGERLSYYLIGGGSMKQVLSNYTALTGRPGLPPAWSFGLYLSTSFTTSYDQDTVSKFLQGMRDRGCPVRVLHLDCFWMRRYDWCSFTFDPEAFPDPRAYLEQVKKQFNVKISVWINPYISQRSALFKEGAREGYFIKRTNGDVWQWDLWQPGMAVVDFTNPAASEWYANKLETLLDMGVDGLKTDFGERIPHVDVKFHDGTHPRKAHNFYAHLYNKCVFELIQRKKGKYEAALFARAATAGGQRFPIHWGGDCESTYEAMAETLRGGLSLTSSGFAFWSHDIGGFEGTPPETLFTRWLAFGLFSTHSRLHGSASYRVPWLYGDAAVAACKKLVQLKLRLMPYLYAESVKSHEQGVPVMRSMVIEFPEDLTAPFLDKQYMFGDSLLVAPVFSDTIAKVYIPEGRWTCFWTGDVVEGPRWVVTKDYPTDRLPVYVRPGSVLLLGPEGIDIPDYAYGEVELEARAYVVEGKEVSVRVPTGQGAEWAGEVTLGSDGKIKSSGGVKAQLWQGHKK